MTINVAYRAHKMHVILMHTPRRYTALIRISVSKVGRNPIQFYYDSEHMIPQSINTKGACVRDMSEFLIQFNSIQCLCPHENF